MILVDTSVWIDHLRSGSEELGQLLGRQSVLMHPFVRGEIACGKLLNRAEVLGYLQRLPHAVVAEDGEVIDFIERRALAGRGIGYVDAHLLASCLLTDRATLWTRDMRLAAIAAELDVG